MTKSTRSEPQSGQQPSFEEALAELEKIVAERDELKEKFEVYAAERRRELKG